jgi:hypothetical protein
LTDRLSRVRACVLDTNLSSNCSRCCLDMRLDGLSLGIVGWQERILHDIMLVVRGVVVIVIVIAIAFERRRLTSRASGSVLPISQDKRLRTMETLQY